MSNRIAGSLTAQMAFIYEGNGWHASLRELLEETAPEQAGWRPADGGHTIYEITVHLAYSLEENVSRCKGNTPKWEEEKSWIATPSPLPESDWAAAIARLREARESFIETISRLSDDVLFAERQDRSTLADTLQQVVHHEAYHAGQIALLRRMQQLQTLL